MSNSKQLSPKIEITAETFLASLAYRVCCRGGSESFTKVRVLCDLELRDKGEASARKFINCINKMRKRDTETCSGASSHPHAD
ncbi:hypothetical protein YC2023_115897 [Brassica napus]